MVPEWVTDDLQRRILEGVIVTLWLTALTTVTATSLGTLLALGRRSPIGLRRRVAATVTEVSRNVPALIAVIFFAFAVPNLVPSSVRGRVFFNNAFMDFLSSVTGLPLPYYAFAGALALTLNSGGHLAEILRSGMAAIPQSQIDAARSLGASRRVVNQTLIVPDGFRLAFAGVSNRLVHNMKNTALVSFVAVPDLFGAVQGGITRTFRATELLVFAAVAYLVIAGIMGVILGRIEAWLWRGRAARRSLGV